MAKSQKRFDAIVERQVQILDAAAECFMNGGYEDTTIDDIADKIDSTKGLIYYNYRSKADLFFAVYRRAMELTNDAVRPYAATAGTGYERLRGMSLAHIHLLMEILPYHHVTRLGIERHLLRAMTPAQLVSLRALLKLRDQYEHLFANVIAEGISDETLEKMNVSIAAKTLLGGLNSVSVWYRPRRDQSQQDRHAIAASIVAMLLNGYRTRAHVVQG